MPEDHIPRKYEAQFRQIIVTHDIVEVTLWVFVISTDLEWEWWRIKLLEWETGEHFTNAKLKEVYGCTKAQALRVAGLRLQEKLVKAFLETDEEEKSV
jgi:hypothetical protein